MNCNYGVFLDSELNFQNENFAVDNPAKDKIQFNMGDFK